MNALSNVFAASPDARTDVHPAKTITQCCGLVLVASLCAAACSLDLSVAFF
jgi:hypothetical protein